MSLTNVHIVATSGNAKTGPMPVTYRPVQTCPRTCAFLPKSEGGNGGCYGTGRIFGIASKYATAETSHADAVAKLNRAPRGAKYMRDRVVGDIVAPDGTADVDYLTSIAAAAAAVDLTPFGYTHGFDLLTPGDVQRVAAAGYVLNASCETIEDVRRAVAKGLPATIVAGPELEDGTEVRTHDGMRRVVTCPAQTREDVSCASCGLCAKPRRAAVVRFLPHGTAVRQAEASIDGRNGR